MGRLRGGWRLRVLLWLGLVGVFGTVVGTVPATGAPAPSAVGKWAAPFNMGLVAIHMSLLPHGDVLIFEKPSAGSDVGSKTRVWNPVTGFHAPAVGGAPTRTDVFCSGQTVMYNGQVFSAGGHDWNSAMEGRIGTEIFRPGTDAWSAGPDMNFRRWYPTVKELPDGRILIISGWGAQNEWVSPIERYNPANGSLDQLPASADLPMELYPRMFLMKDGTFVRVGTERQTIRFNPATSSWSPITQMIRAAGRETGVAVQLPGLDRIMTFGGAQGSSNATASAEWIDMSAGSPKWTSLPAMHYPRRWANGVVLPDGNVLAIGGGRSGSYDKPVKQAELFNPTTKTWTVMATEKAPRMYHSTALLLPDGRVLSAGQNRGSMMNTGEIYSPPYLFKGARPVIGSSPGSLGYGGNFTVGTAQAGSIGRVALIRPGSVTHSVDFDQRFVDLGFTAGGGSLTVNAPANANIAPPGWYMLFIVTKTGIPSVAAWVNVG